MAKEQLSYYRHCLYLAFCPPTQLVMHMKVLHYLKWQYKQAQWTIVTWEHNRSYLSLLGPQFKIIALPKEKLGQIQAGAVFPQTLGMNLVWDQLEIVMHTQYCLSINASAEALGTRLQTIIKAKEYLGPSFNRQANLEFTNVWDQVQNEIYPRAPRLFHPLDLLSARLKLPRSTTYAPFRPLKELDGEEYWQQLFHHLRQQPSIKQKKMIGLDVGSLLKLQAPVMKQWYQELIQSDHYYPLWLVQKQANAQQEFIQQLSDELGIKMMVVHYQTQHLSPCLLRLEALVTAHGVCKQLAHLYETPTISYSELSTAWAAGPSYVVGDLVVTASLPAGSCIALLGELLDPMGSEVHTDAPDSVMLEALWSNTYRVCQDEWGLTLQQLSFEFDEQVMRAQLQRGLIYQVVLESQQESTSVASASWREYPKALVSAELHDIELRKKIVLTLLRLQTQINQSKNSAEQFFSMLDQLLEHRFAGSHVTVTAARLICDLHRPMLLSVEQVSQLEVQLLKLKQDLSHLYHLLQPQLQQTLPRSLHSGTEVEK